MPYDSSNSSELDIIPLMLLSDGQFDEFSRLTGSGKYKAEKGTLQGSRQNKINKQTQRSLLREMRLQNKNSVSHAARSLRRAISSNRNLISHLAKKHGDVKALAYAKLTNIKLTMAPSYDDLSASDKKKFDTLGANAKDPKKALYRKLFEGYSPIEKRIQRRRFEQKTQEEQRLHVLLRFGPAYELALRDIQQAQPKLNVKDPSEEASAVKKPLSFRRAQQQQQPQEPARPSGPPSEWDLYVAAQKQKPGYKDPFQTTAYGSSYTNDPHLKVAYKYIEEQGLAQAYNSIDDPKLRREMRRSVYEFLAKPPKKDGPKSIEEILQKKLAEQDKKRVAFSRMHIEDQEKEITRITANTTKAPSGSLKPKP